MKNTVVTEMRSWSDVAKKNCENSSSVTPKNIKQAVKSAVSEEDRLHNVMVFGLKELDEDDVHEAEDEGMVEEIMNIVDMAPKHLVSIERIGERKEGSIRPLKLRMERKECVLEALSRSRRLKDTEDYKTTY